jgi:hypothetical protein
MFITGKRPNITTPAPRRQAGTNLLRKTGKDLLHLKMSYNKATDNFCMQTTTIANNFNAAVDAALLDSKIYVIEHGAEGSVGGQIWKITLPKK